MRTGCLQQERQWIMRWPVALTIAGSDSGGGAGIQADLKTFYSLGVHGTCAITSITGQNTLGVRTRFDVPVEVVVAQVEAVVEDMEVAAVKTGMLATVEVVRAVSELADRYSWNNMVVDPVAISSSGQPLLDRGAEECLRELLLPRARVFTPNLREAATLTGLEVTGVEEMKEAARSLWMYGARLVVVKGGHLPGRCVVDVVYDGKKYHELKGPRVYTADDHGTGCVFSSAVTAFLALGLDPLDAIRRAKEVVTRALAGSLRLGKGRGPVNP